MSHSIATRRGLLLGTAAAAAAIPVGAAEAQPEPADVGAVRGRANQGTVGVISGGVDGTYIRIAADLAGVLDDGDRLRVLPIVGKGSVQNLSDIIYLRGVDIGIVQSDALAYVVKQRLFPTVNRSINYIAKLYDEEVHVLARPEITRLEDLAGKQVNVDVPGSGTSITAELIFSTLRIQAQATHFAQDLALERLRNGDIAAMVYVTGKPARLFASIPADSGLHFVPVPAAPELLETYLPTQLGPDSYPALIPNGAAVETLAVGAVMAVYAWRPGTERHARVARFVDALNQKFAEFQRPPRHPKWREVNLSAQVPGWTRFGSSEPAAAPAPAPAAAPPRRRGYRHYY